MKSYRQIISGLIIGLLLFSSLPVQAVSVDNSRDDEAVRTVDEINKMRSLYGIPELQYNEILNKTAKTHNQYMKLNNIFSTIEEKDKVYYRGRYPWDRAVYHDYQERSVFELLNKGNSNLLGGLKELLQNPYARHAILDPLYKDCGMNSYEGYTTYLFGGNIRDKAAEVVYPYNGQTDIPVQFENKYAFDPYASNSVIGGSFGIPISYTMYTSDGQMERVNNLTVKLTNVDTNQALRVRVITPLEDRKLNNTIMILPLEPYQYGTTYKIQLSADLVFNSPIIYKDRSSYYREITINSNFSTVTSTESNRQNKYVTREMFVKELMEASSFEIKTTLEAIFPDVNSLSRNYKYIYTAYVNNIIRGYGDGKYRPNANITKEQVYTILIRSYEKQIGTIILSKADMNLSFSDKSEISSYALEPLYKAVKIGLLRDSSYRFKPKDYIEENEFKDTMAKYKKILDEKLNNLTNRYYYY